MGRPAGDPREDLARAVARRSTPGVAELLDGLADDPHPEVWEAVATVREARRSAASP
jgi:hypothetical protein